MRRAFLALLVLAVAQRAAGQQGEGPPAEQYTVRLEYLFWSPLPEGQFQKGVSGIEGTLIDAQADLGLAEHSMNPVRGSLRLGTSWKLRGSWAPIDFRGDAVADRAFVYGTTVVRPGDEVVTTLKGSYVTAELAWDFVRRPQGFLGLLFGVKYFDVDALVLDATTSSRVVETERLPLPVLGLAGRIYLGRYLSLEGEVSGLTLGDRGHVVELLLAGRLHVTRRLAATAGWHRLALEGRDDRDYLKLDLGTWTFGAEISL